MRAITLHPNDFPELMVFTNEDSEYCYYRHVKTYNGWVELHLSFEKEDNKLCAAHIRFRDEDDWEHNFMCASHEGLNWALNKLLCELNDDYFSNIIAQLYVWTENDDICGEI